MITARTSPGVARSSAGAASAPRHGLSAPLLRAARPHRLVCKVKRMQLQLAFEAVMTCVRRARWETLAGAALVRTPAPVLMQLLCKHHNHPAQPLNFKESDKPATGSTPPPPVIPTPLPRPSGTGTPITAGNGTPMPASTVPGACKGSVRVNKARGELPALSPYGLHHPWKLHASACGADMQRVHFTSHSPPCFPCHHTCRLCTRAWSHHPPPSCGGSCEPFYLLHPHRPLLGGWRAGGCLPHPPWQGGRGGCEKG